MSGPLTHADVQFLNALTSDLPAEQQKECTRIINRHKEDCLAELKSKIMNQGKAVPSAGRTVNPEDQDTTAANAAMEETLAQGLHSLPPWFSDNSRQPGLCSLTDPNSPVGSPDQGPQAHRNPRSHRFSPYGRRPERVEAIPKFATTSGSPAHGAFANVMQGLGQTNDQTAQPARTAQAPYPIHQIDPKVAHWQQASGHTVQPPPANVAPLSSGDPAMGFAPQRPPYPEIFEPRQQPRMSHQPPGYTTMPLRHDMGFADAVPRIYPQPSDFMPLPPLPPPPPMLRRLQAYDQAIMRAHQAWAMDFNRSFRPCPQVLRCPIHCARPWSFYQEMCSCCGSGTGSGFMF
ncbi:hypothetical protein PM082_019593 [Marasmius tenuissimus]|nr:hypothetical protein PM082_019593 [Marasmius tenuissimus]